MPSPWKLTDEDAARMQAALDDAAAREAAECELRYFEAKNSPVPQHIRDTLAAIDPAYDPDLPEADD